MGETSFNANISRSRHLPSCQAQPQSCKAGISCKAVTAWLTYRRNYTLVGLQRECELPPGSTKGMAEQVQAQGTSWEAVATGTWMLGCPRWKLVIKHSRSTCVILGLRVTKLRLSLYTQGVPSSAFWLPSQTHKCYVEIIGSQKEEESSQSLL